MNQKTIEASLIETIALIDQEEWDIAETKLSETRSQLPSGSSHIVRAQLYTLQAMIAEGRNDHEQARTSWLDAVDSMHLQGDGQSLAATLLTFGWSELESGSRCESLLLFQVASELAALSGSGGIARDTQSAMASALVYLGQYELAMERLSNLVSNHDHSTATISRSGRGPTIQDAVRAIDLQIALRNWHRSRLSKEHEQITNDGNDRHLRLVLLAQEAMLDSMAFDRFGERCTGRVLGFNSAIEDEHTVASLDAAFLEEAFEKLGNIGTTLKDVTGTQRTLSTVIQAATSDTTTHSSAARDAESDVSAAEIAARIAIDKVLIAQGRREDAIDFIEDNVVEILTPDVAATLSPSSLFNIAELLSDLGLEASALYGHIYERLGSYSTENSEHWFLRADYERVLGDTNGARGSLRKALELSKAMLDSRSEAAALAKLAYLDFSAGSTRKAESKLKAAYGLLGGTNDSVALSSVCDQLGIVSSSNGKGYRAWEYGLEALSYTYATDDHLTIAERWRDVGTYSQQAKHMSRAIVEVNSALGIYHLFDQRQMVSICFFQMGSVYRDLGDIDEALYHMSISCWLDTTYGLEYEMDHVVHAIELATEHDRLGSWGPLLDSAPERKNEYLERLLSETEEEVE